MKTVVVEPLSCSGLDDGCFGFLGFLLWFNIIVGCMLFWLGFAGLSGAAFCVFTVGYSTRSFDEFVALLRAYGVGLVVDVRSYPRSRHSPQFNKETFPETLKEKGLRYIHLPELGGLRRPESNSINLAWENKSFRGYADYMQTKEFSESLLSLISLIQKNCLAIMCAEALPWRCHRSLLSDALFARHIAVKHILSENNVVNHELTPFAHVEGSKVFYPLYAKEKIQRTLTDFGKTG